MKKINILTFFSILTIVLSLSTTFSYADSTTTMAVYGTPELRETPYAGLFSYADSWLATYGSPGLRKFIYVDLPQIMQFFTNPKYPTNSFKLFK